MRSGGSGLEWEPHALGVEMLANLPEDQITALLENCASIVGTKPPRAPRH
jgi:hypothetical protein